MQAGHNQASRDSHSHRPLVSLGAVRLDSRNSSLHGCSNKCFKIMYEIVAFLTSVK